MQPEAADLAVGQRPTAWESVGESSATQQDEANSAKADLATRLGSLHANIDNLLLQMPENK